MATAGDRIRDLPLATAPSSGAFTYLVDSSGDSKADRAAMQNWLQTNSDSSLRFITTQAQLTSALTDAGALTLRLGANITLPSGVTTVPIEKSIEFNTFKFIKGSGSSVGFFGKCVAERRQIFSGFTAGDIIGTFGRSDVYPEWWGLTNDYHDIAINCAIKASSLVANGYSVNVSLAPRTYDVSAPLDLSSTAATLEGAGSSLTFINATTNWNATWLKSDIWGDLTGPANHAAMIWIGGDLTSDPAYNARTYHTKVKGMAINCYYAAFPYRLDGSKRVSGISSKFWVEECSVIHDVVISNASGFGIGFCQHKAPGADWTLGSSGAAVVNGLDISSCWIMGATFRDFYGMYFSQWTNNCTVRNTTVDIGLAKSISSQYGIDTSPANGGFDTSTVGTTITSPAPAWICTYPQTAIHAAGYLTLTDIHIEGSVIGVLIPETEGASTVSCTNIKGFALMDTVRGAVYELDGRSGKDPSLDLPTSNINNTDVYNYGCTVLIAGRGPAPLAYPNQNWKGCATLNGISAGGGSTYLLRDDIYGIHQTSFGQGQFPAGDLGGRIAFYTRGNIYSRETTSPYNLIGGGTYNKADPTSPQSTSRTFFLGPIF
jgi:hypothetical protein